MKAALLTVLIFISIPASAQDPAATAAQQAMQQTITINQQAIQQAQQAHEQAIRDSQLASDQAMRDSQRAAPDSTPAIAMTRTPEFSVQAGEVAPGTKVRLKCPTHYAVIYYTTNGWTPTTSSRRYTGPIPIDATTEIQVMAIAPNMVHSLVARAVYTVPGSAKQVEPLALTSEGLLAEGTSLHLVTAAAADSKSAQVGDTLHLLLDQDIKSGDTIVVPKGTPVEATITQADPAGHAGMPGDLAFVVHELRVNGTVVPLEGGETLEGVNHYGKVKGLILIPGVGIAGLAVHGDEAQIKPGMVFTASVARDTHLQP